MPEVRIYQVTITQFETACVEIATDDESEVRDLAQSVYEEGNLQFEYLDTEPSESWVVDDVTEHFPERLDQGACKHKFKNRPSLETTEHNGGIRIQARCIKCGLEANKIYHNPIISYVDENTGQVVNVPESE